MLTCRAVSCRKTFFYKFGKCAGETRTITWAVGWLMHATWPTPTQSVSVTLHIIVFISWHPALNSLPTVPWKKLLCLCCCDYSRYLTTRSLGVIFDNQLSLSMHVTALCRSGYFHVRQLHPVVQSLTTEAAKTVIQAFICCRLDYCNSLLYDTSDSLI